jgi:hypothetical protein
MQSLANLNSAAFGKDAPPIVGGPHTGYGEQEWIGAIAVVGFGLLVLCFRRFCSARDAQWAFGDSLAYALFFRRHAGANQQVPASHGLLVGQDNRYSTSKTTAAIWTGIVLYFIVVAALVLGFNHVAFDKLIGQISPLYLVFLGGPFAAAVIAKATVSNAVAAGDQQKSQSTSPRVADVFSDDDGNADLVDLQYLAFNLVVAVIVLVEFVHGPGYGAPTVPDFLAGLTGTSAATYVANKALVSGNAPTIVRFAPSSIRPGGQVLAIGTNLIAQGDTTPPTVFIADGPPTLATDNPPRADQATFRVPSVLPFGNAVVAIQTPSGLEVTSDSPLQIVQDALVVVLTRQTDAIPNSQITLIGSGFYQASDVDVNGTPGRGAVSASVSLTGRTAGAPAHVCQSSQGTDMHLTVTVPDDILANEPAGLFDVSVARGGFEVTLGTPLNIHT